MAATLIDGKAVAAGLRLRIAAGVAELAAGGHVPGLAVVLVGEDPASQVYVRSKAKQTEEAGMRSMEHKLPVETTQADLLAIRAKNGQNASGPNDPFDPNKDGKINVADVRYCQLRLTPP